MNRVQKALEKAIGLRQDEAVEAGIDATQDGFSLQEPEESGFQPPHPCIVAYQEPDSPVAEEYRKLKAVLLRSTRAGFRNTVMVTSALSGEGKSITSANLAIMLSRDYGQTVLLVDADVRRPTLHEYLGLQPAFGLADCLEDGLDVGSAIVRTGLHKLSFLSAGKKPADPAELLSSQKMKDFLAEVKHRYRDRYIIIDTAPVLLFAETQAISAMVDGVLAVVKEGGTSVKAVGQMLEHLNSASVLGIIYNDASAANLDGRYRHYYDYYYRSRDWKKQEAAKE